MNPKCTNTKSGNSKGAQCVLAVLLLAKILAFSLLCWLCPSFLSWPGHRTEASEDALHLFYADAVYVCSIDAQLVIWQTWKAYHNKSIKCLQHIFKNS